MHGDSIPRCTPRCREGSANACVQVAAPLIPCPAAGSGLADLYLVHAPNAATNQRPSLAHDTPRWSVISSAVRKGRSQAAGLAPEKPLADTRSGNWRRVQGGLSAHLAIQIAGRHRKACPPAGSPPCSPTSTSLATSWRRSWPIWSTSSHSRPFQAMPAPRPDEEHADDRGPRGAMGDLEPRHAGRDSQPRLSVEGESPTPGTTGGPRP